MRYKTNHNYQNYLSVSRNGGIAGIVWQKPRYDNDFDRNDDEKPSHLGCPAFRQTRFEPFDACGSERK